MPTIQRGVKGEISMLIGKLHIIGQEIEESGFVPRKAEEPSREQELKKLRKSSGDEFTALRSMLERDIEKVREAIELKDRNVALSSHSSKQDEIAEAAVGPRAWPEAVCGCLR